MSYEKAMKWHKKHPGGIKNLYMGFDVGNESKTNTSTAEQDKEFRKKIFLELIKKARSMEFPVYIEKFSIGHFFTNPRSLFCIQINSIEEMQDYYEKYI